MGPYERGTSPIHVDTPGENAGSLDRVAARAHGPGNPADFAAVGANRVTPRGRSGGDVTRAGRRTSRQHYARVVEMAQCSDVARGVPAIPDPHPAGALRRLGNGRAEFLEVTWSRLLTLQFGHTTGASSTVLAAFMGGLAVGSGLGGRLAERRARADALRLYALLESIIVASALTLPLAIAAARPLLEWAYADGNMVWRFGAARLVASLLALAIPTIAMGATYPVAARALATERTHTEHAAGRLYTRGTPWAPPPAPSGGLPPAPDRRHQADDVSRRDAERRRRWSRLAPRAGGCRSTLPRNHHSPLAHAASHSPRDAARERAASPLAQTADAQIQGTGHAGVATPRREDVRGASASDAFRHAPGEARERQAAEAAAAVALGKSRGARRGGRRGMTTTVVAQSPLKPVVAMWVGLVAAATSGLVALMNQVVWTRVLAPIVGPTTFAFSAMVGVFIAGLAVGAGIGTRLARGRRAMVWLGVMGLAVRLR